jgi:hypothetical protein
VTVHDNMKSNVELTTLFEEDQRDRSGPVTIAPEVHERDVARRRRVHELLERDAVETADDCFHAAMILHHADAVAEIEEAQLLARRAIAIDPEHAMARWLVAASEDRALMYRNKPQRWGTQFKLVDGRMKLWPVDPSTTDADRARWGVPSIEEQTAREAELDREP